MTGSCLCGAIRYEIIGQPLNQTVCHCDGCRRASGAPAVAWLTVARDAFRLSGSLRYVSAPAPRPGTCDGCCNGKRGFCPVCGSQMTFEDSGRADQVDVTVGTLDDPATFKPTQDVFADQRLPWVQRFASPGKQSGMEPRISIITLGVKDMPRSIRFYRDGLGFPTDAADDARIAFFATAGTRLALYPLAKLAEDVAPDCGPGVGGFQGITLAHNVRRKQEVAEVLALAQKAGGRIVKPAQDVFWGGHSGYFADLDGYFWEVAWSPRGAFDETGAVVL